MALKTFKPTTPGQRQLVLVDRSDLYKGKPVKGLVDFKRRKLDVPATVERIEYDPNRTAFIALIKYADGELSYILAPQRLAVGDSVVSSKQADVKPGNAMPL